MQALHRVVPPSALVALLLFTGCQAHTETGSPAAPVEETVFTIAVLPDMAGAGFLRLMQVDTRRRRIDVFTYSPWLDVYDVSAGNEFSFSYESHLATP